ncbi:MAG: T9SS type A sorting domain-containing protein [candidate division KSB1 bacterium]|nr:T9SS type A sorting domain-containing protein [candidate division KSB1 bacterium]
MRRMLFLVLLLCPLGVFAQEQNVPIGTEGNLFILSIKNAHNSVLDDVQVTVQSTPDWVVFTPSTISAGSIPTSEQRDVVFEFRVLDVEADKLGTVLFKLMDGPGRLLGYHVIRFRTVLQPKETRLELAYPNPANPETAIRYVLQAPSQVKLGVYDILGRHVRMLVDGEKPSGVWSVSWDGRNEQGVIVASGTYFIRLRVVEKATGETKEFTSKVLIQK